MPCGLRVCKKRCELGHKALLGQILELRHRLVFGFRGKIAVLWQIVQPFQMVVDVLRQPVVLLRRCGLPDSTLNIDGDLPL